MISDEELASVPEWRLGKIVQVDPRMLAFRGAEGETLLHVSQFGHVVAALIAIRLDPNARDASGRTPLMWPHDLDGNRRLIEGGADVLAEDARGNTTLAHQSGGLTSGCGYSGPDFAALEALLDCGVRRPTEEEARRWVENSRASVTHHMEHSEFKRFEAWVDGWSIRRSQATSSSSIDRPSGWVTLDLSKDLEVVVTALIDGRDYDKATGPRFFRGPVVEAPGIEPNCTKSAKYSWAR